MDAPRRHLAPAWDWDRVQRLCLREASRVLGPGAACEDAAQEALIRAWRQRGSCRDPANPGPWVRRIAHNEALRVVSRPRDAGLDTVPEPVGEHDVGAVAAADLARRMVRRLPETDRRLLFLQHWEDVPISEIADRLQMPEGTVKIRLHRARASLRRMMEEDP